MVVGGALALAFALDVVLGLQGKTRWICGTVATLAFGPLVLSGVGLIRRVRGALLAGALAWLPLLFIIQIHGVGYSAVTPPGLQLKIWPEFGYSASLGPSFALYWDDDEEVFYYGVNVMALLACTYLGERAWRRFVRLRRMRRVREAR